MEPEPLHRQRSKVRFSPNENDGASTSTSTSTAQLTQPLLSEEQAAYERAISSGYSPPASGGVATVPEAPSPPSEIHRHWEEDRQRAEFLRPRAPLPPLSPHTYPPGVRQPQRTESLWMGDDSRFKQKLQSEWSPLQQMESLDYDIVDNRVLRERGRHRSVMAMLTVTVLIGSSQTPNPKPCVRRWMRGRCTTRQRRNRRNGRRSLGRPRTLLTRPRGC
jgi:hypothetical protein